MIFAAATGRKRLDARWPVSIRMASGPDGAGDAIGFLGYITLLGEVDRSPDVAPMRDDGYNSAGRRL